MARYLNLTTLQPRLYCSGSPVIIEAGALHKDTLLGDIVLQLKFRSLVKIAISALTVDVTCLDAAGQIVASNFTYQYTNISDDKTEAFFGQKTLITLPSDSIRSVVVRVTEVQLVDESKIHIDCNKWEPIPKQDKLSAYGDEFEKHIKQKYGTKSSAIPTEFKDLWICTCTQENKQENTVCSLCGTAQSDMSAFNIESEKKDIIYNRAKNYAVLKKYDLAIKTFASISGWKDADEQIKEIEKIAAQAEADRLEEERKAEIERKNAARKTKRNTIITCIAVVAVIAIFIVSTTVIIPNNNYNKAMLLIDEGNYIEAYEALVALGGYKDSTDKAASIYTKYRMEKIKEADVGDYVLFGTYEQDNNTDNGKEDIEWLVLENYNGKALVISKYALDYKPYSTGYTDTTWETCSLRKWLNNDFIDAAFSADEKAAIHTSTVLADKNPEYNTNPGNATRDKIFLLSIADVNNYFSSDDARVCESTDYAVANLVLERDGNDCWWWLRTPGYRQEDAACVGENGCLKGYGYFINNSLGAVRPVMRIDLSKLS